jgi:hypothetical protein
MGHWLVSRQVDSDSSEVVVMKHHSVRGFLCRYRKGMCWIVPAASSVGRETVVWPVYGVGFVAVGELVQGSCAVAQGTGR